MINLKSLGYEKTDKNIHLEKIYKNWNNCLEELNEKIPEKKEIIPIKSKISNILELGNENLLNLSKLKELLNNKK